MAITNTRPGLKRGHWITSAALCALARLAPVEGNTFTRASLAEAMGADPRRSTEKLKALGFITMKRTPGDDGSVSYDYTVTCEGAAAINAAASGHVLTGGGFPMHPAKPGTLRWRLWSLLRARRALDGDEAAAVLCDAGDKRYVSTRNRINDYLRRWRDAQVLELSAAKLPKGRKRYVLVKDPGPTVPAFLPRSTVVQAGKGA